MLKKKVFIVGNGFDLNLGWETGYKDFVNSDYSPIHSVGECSCSMEEYLARKTKIDGWYDLECILREYAAEGHESHRKAEPKDEPFFYDLCNCLSEYIKSESKKQIDTESLAVKVLKAIVANGYFSSIYTFNYTNLYDVAEKAGINSRFDFEYVHGTVANNAIVLGVDAHTELRDGYGYLRKGFNPHYRTRHIRYDLQECDEVVFFGHSLGDMDYPYFRDFFFAQSRCDNRNAGKRITMFTKDNHSRIQILEHLRIMNDGEIEHLMNDNEFSVIMTDAPDKVALNIFFEHLGEDCIKTENDLLNQLASSLY